MSATEQSETASAPLDLGASSHEQMDEAVLSFLDLLFVGRSSDDLSLIDLARILSLVSLSSKSLLDDKYDVADEAERLLRGRLDLQQAIREAFGARSFEKVRNMRMLWSSKAKALEPRHDIFDDAMVLQLGESFIHPYNGAAVDGFIEYLKSNNIRFNSKAYYAKFCSIVQSSGTGKSRLMIELRHRGVIVIYMNLRPKDDRGFPERDNIPANILADPETLMKLTRDDYFARCCNFFEALFKTIQAEFQSVSQDENPDAVAKFIRNWSEDMCAMGSTSRATFFSGVQTEYDKIRAREASDGKSTQGNKTGTSNSDMVKAYTAMLLALPHIIKHKEHEPQLVIAFDEAHPLSAWQGKEFCPSHILCRVISNFSRLPSQRQSVWVVFASTTSKVADFSAPQAIHNSERVAVAGELIFPPYVQLGWDQGAVALRDVSVRDVSGVDHIIHFGRPLWTSLSAKNPQGLDGVIAVAGMKLCKSARYDASNANQALAVLSQRFCLDVCFGHPESVQHLEASVASHLRVCSTVTEDRTWKFTSYPSEPFLSCVAAGLLHHSETTLDNTLEALKSKVDSGLFEIGQNGELASRLLWLLAKDMFVRKVLHANIEGILCNGKREFIDCVRVPVISFLEYVLGESFTKALDDGGQAANARGVFANAFINFSHWVSMGENIASQKHDEEGWSSDEWTLRHLHRTSAVQCCHPQPKVDKMIPIWFDDAEAHEAKDCVSQLFISDKAGKTANKPSLHLMTRDDDSIKCRNGRPWIAVLNDLGVANSTCKATFPAEASHADACLRIYVPGIDCTPYPWMSLCSKSVQTTLQHLIVRQAEPIHPDVVAQYLQRQVQFGKKSLGGYMRWESGKEFPNKE